MTIKAGAAVRDYLYNHACIRRIYDFGETKLFSAAVLPCIILFQQGTTQCGDVGFTSIYETSGAKADYLTDSVFKVIDKEGIVELSDGRKFENRQGVLSLPANGSPWTLSSNATAKWLNNIARNTWRKFSDIGKIRVGIKTTADNVFIKDHWDEAEGVPELLRPLITHRNAGQIVPSNLNFWQVLYTHTMSDGKKVAYDLEEYPIARSYLEKHKDQLSSRNYIRKANRNWYEIWVPQNPNAWSSRKIVFRDIADRPEFWLDDTGAIVNGDCYWIQIADDVPDEVVYLAIAVANSKFIERYYDIKFNNKLYAGKRRFMSQYVSDFPIPYDGSALAQEAISIVRQIICGRTYDFSEQKNKLDCIIDQMFA